jgi:hypothetical protein
MERRPKAEEQGAHHVTFATRAPEHVYELKLHFIAIKGLSSSALPTHAWLSIYTN